MLFESGSNRNHYQPSAEVNSSSPSPALQSNLATTLLPRSSSEQRESSFYGVTPGSHNSSNQIGLSLLLQNQQLLQQSLASQQQQQQQQQQSPPAAESDSVNNNKYQNHHRYSRNNNSRLASNNIGGEVHSSNSQCYNNVAVNNNHRSSPPPPPAPQNPRKNDNECASEILSELDLVASINISLNNLKKQQQHQQQQSNSKISPHNSVDFGDSACLASSVTSSVDDETSQVIITNNNNNNNNNPLTTSVSALNPNPRGTTEKMSDAYLSGVKPESLKNNNNNLRQPISAPNTPETMRKHQMMLRRDLPILSHSMYVSAKKEKMEFNQMMMKMNERDRPISYHGHRSYESPSLLSSAVNKRHVGSASSTSSSAAVVGGAARSRKEATLFNRRSMPSPYLENRFREKFDVSALDTNLPRIDIEAIENHLRLAKEEERKRRSDREEIRRRLALESEDVYEKPSGRKPSLHTRLQSSMNLQICFMNETASDSESPGSDTETKNQQPASLPHVKSGNGNDGSESSGGAVKEDFYTRQARLQAEAKQALAQSKEMARLQMEKEHQQSTSPITVMVRNSLLKVGVTLPPERRRVSRQLLTEMNVAQLQVIVNDLHTHIEVLNETLVSMLLERDDLHMEQDSLLVDIEDATRYLQAKENSSSPHSLPLINSRSSLLGKK